MDSQSLPLDLQASLESGFESAVISPDVPANEFLTKEEYVPACPRTLKEAGLHQNDLFPLVLKFLFLHGNQSGGTIARQIKIPFTMLEPALAALKADLLIGHKQSAGVGDYEYELSPKGIEQARLHLSRSTYCGAAPVSLAAYRSSILRQSIKNLKPTFKAVTEALDDLVVTFGVDAGHLATPTVEIANDITHVVFGNRNLHRL